MPSLHAAQAARSDRRERQVSARRHCAKPQALGQSRGHTTAQTNDRQIKAPKPQTHDPSTQTLPDSGGNGMSAANIPPHILGGCGEVGFGSESDIPNACPKRLLLRSKQTFSAEKQTINF